MLFPISLSPHRLYLTICGVSEFLFNLVFTVNMVYQVQTVGLTPLQLVLVGTVLETTVFLGEAPTGVVADVFSRRLSIIVGFVLIGVGFMVEGAFPVFWAILVAQVLWGLGETFTSGAREAWVADEMGDGNTGTVFVRGAQAGQVAGLAAIPISAGLGDVAIQLPIVLGGALFVALAAGLALVMPERNFRPTPRHERSALRAMGDTFVGGAGLVRRRPALLTLFAIVTLYGVASEGYDRLATPHMLDNFTFPAGAGLDAVGWFSLFRFVLTVLALIATEVVRRWMDTGSPAAMARWLFWISALQIVTIIAFAVAGDFSLAAAALVIGFALRRLHQPISFTWINHSIDDPKVRATVLSMSSQLDALGQIFGGPLIGAVATMSSLRAALAAGGLILSPALLLYGRAARQGGDALDAAKAGTQASHSQPEDGTV
ncbi:MAG: MFS transporter [Chloroflexi bacterium]|nr:MFS transporter [Chloroflexota bacterium]